MGFSSYMSLGAQNYNISNLKMFDSGLKKPSSELGYKYNIINSNGLFLYYPFDVGSTSGTSVGNYATGTGILDAIVAGTTSVGNNVLNTTYNPTPNGMTINRLIPCNTSSGMSISFWFNTSSIPKSDYYFLFTIQNKGGTRWFLTIDPTNRISVNNRAIGFTVSVNTWYHCALTVEPNNNKGIIYMNNVVYPQAMAYPGFNNDSGSNSIANDPFGHGVVGTVDEFRLYNRILTPPQIQTLYYSGYSKVSPLVGDYAFRVKGNSTTVPTTDTRGTALVNNGVVMINDAIRGYVFSFNNNLLTINVPTPVSNTRTFWMSYPNTFDGNPFGSKSYSLYYYENKPLIVAPGFPSNKLQTNITEGVTWKFYAITVTATRINIYINGDYTPVFASDISNWNGDTSITTFGGYDGYAYFTGCLDDMRLYNGILSDSVMLQVYNGNF